MKHYFTLFFITASSLSLAACFEATKSSSAQINYQPVPIQGSYTDNAAHAVFSTDEGQGPVNTRFDVQFTANEELVITDNQLSKTYTFAADQVVGDSFNELEFMSAFMTVLNNSDDIGGEPDWNDPVAVNAYLAALEDVSILTPTNTNNNEYALARVSSVDGQQWMLVGDPTSAALTGTASYTGGAYLTNGHARMTMNADFANANNAIAVTLAPYYDPADTTMFGATSIGFNADFDNATNTISAAGNAVSGGGDFDTVDVHGAFFNNGAASAGLLRLQDSTAAVDDVHGGYHVVRD